jgi:hypothetical protein
MHSPNQSFEDHFTILHFVHTTASPSIHRPRKRNTLAKRTQTPLALHRRRRPSRSCWRCSTRTIPIALCRPIVKATMSPSTLLPLRLTSWTRRLWGGAATRVRAGTAMAPWFG